MNSVFKRRSFSIFASLCILFFALASLAKDSIPGLPPSVFVDADQYNSHADQSADLVGHVKIIRGAEQLTCDKAHINLATDDFLAEGNVVFITPTDFIKAERMTYNFHTQKGIIQNGFLQSGTETIEGEEITKISDKEFQAKNATYTSCVNCPPSWKFAGTKIDATIGNYAYLNNATIRLYGVPVLWLPYAVVPIKSERQSGFLAPSVGFSNGVFVGDSYFWAIDKSKDTTLTETSFAARGLKTGLEYRFVADKNSKGKFLGNFLQDAFYSGDSRYTTPDCRYTSQGCLTTPQTLRNTSAPIPRFSLHYEHHYELPDNYINNINLNLVKDSNYVSDFAQDMAGGGDAALENRINLTKNSENSHISADIDIYQNLLRADPVGQNDDAVHRVPELRYSLMPTKIWGVRAGLDIDYVNFFRAGQSYDEANGLPGFQPTTVNPNDPKGAYQNYTDRFRTGQRVIVKPNLTYPVNIGDYLDLVPELSYEEDYYQFGYGAPATNQTPEVKPTASRRSVRSTLRSRTRLNSVLTIGDDPKTNKFKHELIPEVAYTYVPYIYQDQHAFFLGNLVNNNGFGGGYIPQYQVNQPVTEFDNMQFDYRDRPTELNMITFGVSNVLIQKKGLGPNPKYNQLIRHRLTQSYDFYTANGPDKTPGGIQIVKQPWSEIHSLLEVRLDNLSIDNDVSYYGYVNAASDTTSISLHNPKGDSVSLGYAEAYASQIDQTTGLIVQQIDLKTRSRAISLRGYVTSKFLDLAAVTNYDVDNYFFTNYIVYALIRPPGKCWGLALTFEHDLGAPNTNTTVSLPIFFGDTPNQQYVPRPPGV